MTLYDTFATTVVALVMIYRSLLAPYRASVARKMIFLTNGRAVIGGAIAALLISGVSFVDGHPVHVLTGLVVGIGVAALIDLPAERARHAEHLRWWAENASLDERV